MVIFWRSFMVILAAVLSSCGSEGISGPGRTASLGVDLSMLTPKAGSPAAGPWHLAVAQAGAIRPHEDLLEALRS